jgi:hypothetical protein
VALKGKKTSAPKEKAPEKEMSIAPGGLIHQTIVPDKFSSDSWDPDNMAMFNVQLIDVTSCDTLGIPVPSTPITAQTYAENGFKFFKMYEEPSNIFGKFNVQSIGKLDDAAGTNAETHEAEV